MGKNYWNNFATVLNQNAIDPTLRQNQYPLEMHDEDYGIAFRYHEISDDFGWDVVRAAEVTQ